MAAPASNLCVTCGIRPRYQQHPYCGKTCAKGGTPQKPQYGIPAPVPSPSWSAPPAIPAMAPMIGICQLPMCSKPVFRNPITGVPSNYCSKGHMNQAAAGAPNPMPVLGQPNPPHTGYPQASFFNPPPVSPPGACQLPGCPSPVWVDAAGKPSQYCGKLHRDQHAKKAPHQGFSGGNSYGHQQAPPAAQPPRALTNPCLWCKAKEQYTGSPFCGITCKKNAQSAAPSLLEIPPGHATFKSVADQFTKKWQGGTPKTIKHVYMVLVSAASMQKYQAYQSAVEAKRNCAAKAGVDPGNQQRRWHGTKRMCKLGDPGQTKLCSNSTCALCSIIRSSFSMAFASSGCFGRGIYTSSTSSKSDGYSSNMSTSPLKAMLLNKVIVGRGYKLNTMNTSLTAAPAGFDSVLGQLGNDELIVYTEDAIRPAYLLMYA